jgi:hypothetical protein
MADLSEDDSPTTYDNNTDAEAPRPLPESTEEWQRHLSTLPAKDVLRLLNEDKARANRILSGFRPSGDALKNPRVITRLIEEATKKPEFARLLIEISPKTTPTPAPVAKTAPGTVPREVENLKKEIQILRESLEKRKATVQEREMELRERTAALVRAEHERDLAKQGIAQAREAQAQAETDALRLRHQLRREERREERKTEKPESAPPLTNRVPQTPSLSPPPLTRSSVLAEGAERLLRRGRYAPVADLCREALNGDVAKEDSAERGRVHALYATALYGQGEISLGEEQSRLALTALLDGGDILGATEAATRFLAESKTVRKTDAEPLLRLLLLARRAGLEEAVASVFRQLRLRSRSGYQRLIELLGNRAKGIFPATPSTEQIGPDDTVVLPTFNTIPLTPRRIVRAVQTGETELIARVRQGIAALRNIGTVEAKRADALLEAIATLDAIAVEPLLRITTTPVLVDASNVARFNPDPLALSGPSHTENLRLMRDHLLRSGFFPVVLIADANLSHFMDDRAAYQNLVANDILQEVPAGTSADEELIRQARLRNAPIVTNDTFSDREGISDINRLAFHIVGSIIGLMPR